MFKKMHRSRAVNVVFAVFIAVLLAVPFAALPAAAQVLPYIEVAKTVDPKEIWLQGEGSPDATTVTLTLDGQGDIQATHAPVDVVLIIDRSGSMAGVRLTGAQIAATSFVDQMGATDYGALVSYATTVSTDYSLALMTGNPSTDPGGATLNKLAIENAINALSASGWTAMGDGMHTANQLLIADAASGRPLVAVLLTDGYHNRGSWTPTSATTEAVNNNITYYTIGLGYGVNTSQLESIASDTGGDYYHAPSPADLADIYNAISNTIINTAGVNVTVTEILQSHIKYVGNATIEPDSVTVNADGTTTLVWTIGSIAIGDSWEVSFDVSSSKAGAAVPIDADTATVTYTDWQGIPASKAIPQATVAVKGHMAVEVNVAPAYFAGQEAEIYILATMGGSPEDVNIDKVTIWYQEGDEHKSIEVDLGTIEKVSEGLYKFVYEIPDGAPGGAYKVVAEVSAITEYGTSSGIFQVISVPLPIVLPMWAWALIALGVIFVLMIIAVRIAR